MKVLALGGSGGMGRYAVRELAASNLVESIVVADLNTMAAARFAATLPAKVGSLGLDVTDREALRAAMRDADLVANFVGPFFRFAPPILECAIECGCHYVDICDDWEPTLRMFDQHEAAKGAGITAILGLGASPGLTNLLALLSMRELDSVHTVYTGWNMSGAVPEDESSQQGANAAMVHGIRQMTGEIRIHRNGLAEMIAPLEEVAVEYPGLGIHSASVFGHPEAVSFPHHYPEIRTSLNLMHGLGGWESRAIRAICWLVNQGWLSEVRAAGILEWLERQGAPASAESPAVDDGLPSVYGLAIGRKDGKDAAVGATLMEVADTSMGFVTGVPLACGIELLAAGKITERGVLAPEGGAIPVLDFFEMLNAKSSLPAAETSDTFVISRSWDPDATSRLVAAVERTRKRLNA